MRRRDVLVSLVASSAGFVGIPFDGDSTSDTKTSASGNSSAVDESAPWPVSNSDYRLSNYSAVRPPVSDINEEWSVNAGLPFGWEGIGGAPVVGTESVYIGGGGVHNGEDREGDVPILYAIDKASGEVRGRVLAGAEKDGHRIACHDLTLTNDYIFASVATSWRISYRGVHKGYVFKIDRDSLNVEWETTVEHPYTDNPIVLDTVVLLGSGTSFDGPFYVLDKDSGDITYEPQEYNEKDAGGDHDKEAQLRGGIQYIESSGRLVWTSGISRFVKLGFTASRADLSTGNVPMTINPRVGYSTDVWGWRTPEDMASRGTVDETGVIITTQRDVLRVSFEDPATAVWSTNIEEYYGADSELAPDNHSVGARFIAGPIHAGDNVVFSAAKWTYEEDPENKEWFPLLVAIDKESGEVVWHRNPDTTIEALSASKHSIFAVTGSDLYVLNADTGERWTSHSFDKPILNPPVFDEDMLYIHLGVPEEGDSDEYELVSFSGDPVSAQGISTTEQPENNSSANTTPASGEQSETVGEELNDNPDEESSDDPNEESPPGDTGAESPGFGVVEAIAGTCGGAYLYRKYQTGDDNT